MSDPAVFAFRLYVVGDAPNSTLAVANLNALCQQHLANRHSIEIVDVLSDPRRSLADGVLLTPTLVKVSPPPVRKIVGTLSEARLVLQALGLAAASR
jgi:circadian clock protein KaiB